MLLGGIEPADSKRRIRIVKVSNLRHWNEEALALAASLIRPLVLCRVKSFMSSSRP